MEDIISERGACGVGFIANLRNEASHSIIEDSLTALGCMEHRGGCGADNDSGDGAGVMTSVPWDLFNDWANKQGLASFDKFNTGVGMVFLPKDENQMKEAKSGTLGFNFFDSGVMDTWASSLIICKASAICFFFLLLLELCIFHSSSC